MTPDDFTYTMSTRGYAVFADVVPAALLARLRGDIDRRIEHCRAVQAGNGLPAELTGAAHHVIGGGAAFDDFLEADFLDAELAACFDGAPYILNSFGAVDNAADTGYAHGARVHRDVRTYAHGFRLMMNMLVMVDPFTIANGATRLLPGSHRIAEKPSDAHFAEHAISATGSAGTIVLFDSNLWHSAAPNTTPDSRRALTLTFTRAFVKQQLDYPRMLGDAYPRSERMRQLLGYNARIPASLDAWYQPPERRLYKPGQG